jgi:Tol biopolymer transport system component
MTTAGAQAAWSPDGQEIAFVRIINYCTMTPDNPTCQKPLTRRLYKVNISNQSLLKLTDTPDTDIYDELHPAWSPAGATITISSEKAGTREIWSVDAFGRGYQTNLTNGDAGVATYPTYGK